ncbi:hypothetical protein ISN45_At05g036790 [Arabidopsis thaliana x Arabidopsis arenosa]|uniref:Uncharacterized protein n=2 Tax=Arabidopsis TaxID=3701 RepID=A0A8T2DJA3_ARASU|nr:hypothetical protein ISN45_At05g036790 [Arabidopsis thaliana x Arabidopsis arenosa]KAG7611537.1 hypothetical protein ISN44_As05g036320 [Arabidopsis suecica]
MTVEVSPHGACYGSYCHWELDFLHHGGVNGG